MAVIMEINQETGEIISLTPEEKDQLGIKEEFFIDSLEKCEWYIGKFVEFDAKRKRLKENFEAMKREIDSSENTLKYFYEKQFITEINKHIPNGKKSIKTLKGKAAFKTCKPTVEIDTMEAIPQQFITTETIVKEKANKEALVEAFEKGESPDGCRYIPERESLSIK